MTPPHVEQGHVHRQLCKASVRDSNTPRAGGAVVSYKLGHLGGHDGDTVDDYTGQWAQPRTSQVNRGTWPLSLETICPTLSLFK